MKNIGRQDVGSWILLYQKELLEQFLGLLVEMNASAQAIKLRYLLLQEGELEGPQRDFSFDKERNMQNHALKGVGTALIIGTDSLIKEIEKNRQRVATEETNTHQSSVSEWIKKIRAAGNYVRHSDEWARLFEDFCMRKNVPMFSFDDRTEFNAEFLKELEGSNPRASSSIKILLQAGLNFEVLFRANRVWEVAEGIALTEVNKSMTMMRKLLED